MANDGLQRTPISNEHGIDKPAGLAAALVVHAVLAFGLLTVFQWHTQPQSVYAELWAPENASGDVVQPKAVTPTPPPEEKIEPTKPTPQEIAERVQHEAEIRLAEEKKRKELEAQAQKKLEQERAEERRRLEEQRQKELEEQRRKDLEAQRKKEQQRQEQLRQQELARILGAAKAKPDQAVGSTKGDKRAVQQNLAGSLNASYSAKVIACIRPHIVFQVPPNLKRGEKQAIYAVHLLPDGSQPKSPEKLKSSGWPAYDAAVERAIRQCNPFPRPNSGQVLPRLMRITFDPVDDKQ